MISNKKWNEILIDCYHQMYKRSTPKLNFKKEFKARTLEHQFYNKYTIDQKVCDEIIDNTIKKYKITGYQRQVFRNSVYLGLSPKFKHNDIPSNNTEATI